MMPKWYQRATWALAKALYAPRLLRELRVEARGLEEIPEGPFVLMSDHSNALDAYVLGALARRPVRFMANLEGVSRTRAALADLIGAYGRRKGANDIAAIRTTFALVCAGETIGLFPEGDRSWDGATSPMRKGAGKLARRLGLPLVIAMQRGNYLARPRWASRPRRGPWSVELAAFGADELGRMTDRLAEAVIAAAIAKDEIKDAIGEGREFEGENCAEGVERLVWRCPICGKADALRGAGNLIACGACSAKWALDANCRIRPLNVPLSLHAAEIGDLKDWSDWQADSLPSFALVPPGGRASLRSEDVVLSRRSGAQAVRVGRGRLSLRGWGKGSELVFESSGGRVVFEAAAVRGFVDNFNVFSEFDHKGQRWRLDFGGRNAIKWAAALSAAAGAPAPGEAA
jgi:1-acyl-sn-glycerol-3-phosphate acyltransferase